VVYFLDISQVSGTRELLFVAKDRGRMGDFCEIFLIFWGFKLMLKNYLLKNVTFFSLKKKLKLNMHSMNLFWAIMGYTEKHKDIKEAIRDAKGGMGRYWNLMEDSMGHPRVPRKRACQRFFKGNSGVHSRKWSSHRDL
jgi:hypothetical protein